MMHIDTVFGLLLKRLDQMGYLDDSAIAVAVDHGNYQVERFGKLSPFIQNYSFSNYHPRKNVKGTINFTDIEGVGFVNVKPRSCYAKDYWYAPQVKDLENYGSKGINLLNELFKIQGCELMYYRDDENDVEEGKIHLRRKCSTSEEVISGRIEYRGKGAELQLKYASENDDHDIFDYRNDEEAVKMMDTRFHSPEEWLAHTYHLDYPCYPELVSRHFKSPRGGDIVISTKGSVVYNVTHGVERNANPFVHDLGLRCCSIVPLLIGGSQDIPQKEIMYCKTVDIVPTLLRLIRVKPHKSVMGNSLA